MIKLVLLLYCLQEMFRGQCFHVFVVLLKLLPMIVLINGQCNGANIGAGTVNDSL